MNLSVVLRHILETPGAVSRADIAASTGVTRATVSRLVDELVHIGLVSELGPSPETTRGRPAVRLAPRPGSVISLGLEVNISYLAVRAVDLTGKVLAEASQAGDFAHSDPISTLTLLAGLGRGALDEATTGDAVEGAHVIGSGLALPGLVSGDALALAPNLGWRDLPLDDLLRPLADLNPLIVANEADLAAFAVANPRPGASDGPASFIYVSGEVGIGAGIIVDHRPLIGAHGWSGEIGHICTDPSGPPCSCGASGCLEAFLGLRALARRAGLPEGSTPTDVVSAARAGSSAARAAIHEGGTALGRALSAVVNTVDIPEILLGGIVAEIGEEIIPSALTELRARTLQSSWSEPEIRIVPGSAVLAVTGAAHRVLEHVVQRPDRLGPIPRLGSKASSPRYTDART
ncbi:ROK family transcriptional regulator [Propionibacterium australiense]|nr:ROK family transcriptional regulator [Propionibacterium australiense]SYZ34547.1 ROK family [Propionibacterium australiense]VEH89677.1 Making large colonies protein [Propionibacterium australiense]